MQIGEIRCSARFGVPNYAACPRYELNGELLTHDGGIYTGADQYHTFVESFQRIRYDTSAKSWAATAIDGTTWHFGTSAATRIHADGDPTKPARWLLAEIENTFGQKICFTYDTTSDVGTAYPETVTYAHDNGCTDAKRKIEFVYETRPDPLQGYAGGIETHSTKRATEIRVLSKNSGGWSPYRRRLLTYAPSGTYTTGRSRLASTQLFGSDCGLSIDITSDPVACSSQPAESFTYSDNDPNTPQWTEYEHPTDSEWKPPFTFTTLRDYGAVARKRAAQSTPMRSGDINGDGLVDLVMTTYTNSSDHRYVATQPAFVFINTGSGWEQDPVWTAAFQQLTYAAAVVTGNVVVSNATPISGTQHLLGVCSAETWLLDDPQLPVSPFVSGTARIRIVKPLEQTVDAPFAIASRHHDLGEQPVPTSWVEVFPSFYLVDLNGDGLDDWVSSVEVSGVHVSVDCNGDPIDLGSVTTTAPRTVRVAFRNTGQGWEADPSLVANMPAIELTIVESEDYLARTFGGGDSSTNPVFSGHCDTFGLLGGTLGVPGDFCVNNVSLSPLFQDLNSDGRPDLIVSERLTQDEPLVGLPDLFGDLQGSPDLWSPTRSRAWLNKKTGWVRAPEFDPPVTHVSQGQHLGFAQVGDDELFPRAAPVDNAVRLADLNNDGLTDISYTAGSMLASPPYMANVFLNRGRGDGTPHSAWCASSRFQVDADLDGVADQPIIEIPECPNAARYNPPTYFLGISGNGEEGPTFLNITDINGDGWPDYFQADGHVKPDGSPHAMWARLNDPATPTDPNAPLEGSAWLDEDAHFEPPIALTNPPVVDLSSWHTPWGVSGVIPFDVNGDGAVDFIRGAENQFTTTVTVNPPLIEFESYISNQSLPDLLIHHDNGRGGVTKFTYAAGSSQRNYDLGILALAHAGEPEISEALHYPDPNVSPLPPNGYNVRWTKRPVATSVTQFAPNLPPGGVTSTFEWSHPRWCAEHQSEFGYRLVRNTRPDGSNVDRFYFQKHGRAGKISRTVLTDASGETMFLHEEDWEILDDPIPGTVELPLLYGKEVVVGRLTREESSNLYVSGSGAMQSRALQYDDVHGYNFISLATFGRETGDLHRHFMAKPLSGSEATLWLRNLVLTETDSTSSDPNSGSAFLSQATYAYSPEGALIQRTDALQRRDGSGVESPLVTSREYDSYGNVIYVEDPDGKRTEFCYDGDVDGANWCPNDFGQSTHSVGVAMKDALGNISTFEPDPISGAIIEAITAFTDDPDLEIGRDAFDRVIEERIITGSSTSFPRKTITFDDHAAPTPIVDEIVYADRAGTLASAVTTTTVTDGFGGTWKTVQESPSGYFGTFLFRDPANRKVLKSQPTVCSGDLCAEFTGDEPALNVTETFSDSLGRPLSIMRPGNELGLFAYASTTKTQPAGGGAGDQFDTVLGKNPKGDLNERILDGDRVVWSDECSNVVAPATATLSGVTCANADTTFYTYHASGEIDTVYDAIATSAAQGYSDTSHHLTYHFDTVGRVRQIDDPNLLQSGDPNSGKTLIDYDLAGNVWKRWNGRGELTETLYDALNRPTWIYPPSGESISQTTYVGSQRQPATVTTDLAQKRVRRHLHHDVHLRRHGPHRPEKVRWQFLEQPQLAARLHLRRARASR